MEKIEDTVARLVKKIVELEERIKGMEQAYASLNNTYNNHISGLHVQRIG